MAVKPKRQRALAVIAVLALTAAAGLTLRPGSQPGPEASYFYDLGAGEIYVHKPGVTAPSGGEGVLAIVFACGDCANKNDRFIGYLTKYSQEYLQVLQSGEPPTPEQVQRSNLVRAETDAQWYPADSRQGLMIVERSRSRCPDQASDPCTP